MPGRANSLALAEALRVFHCRLFPHSAGPYAGPANSLALAEALRVFHCRLLPHSAGHMPGQIAWPWLRRL